MVSRVFLTGISTFAIAAGMAGAANAQSVSGSGDVATCTDQTGSNACTITIVGNNNTATVSQTGAAPGPNATNPGSTRNAGVITIYGNSNQQAITQNNGNDNSGTLLVGQSGASANENSSTLQQTGFGNSATVSQTANFNSSIVRQNGGTQNSTTFATVSGSGNVATVTQNTSQISPTVANGAGTQQQTTSTNVLYQSGTANSASVTQNGFTQASTVIQGAALDPNNAPVQANNPYTTQVANPAAAGQNPAGPNQNCGGVGQPNCAPATMPQSNNNFSTTSGQRNSATVVQNGAFGSSTITQQASGTTNGQASTFNTVVTDNVASVTMDSRTSSVTATANISSITQRSSGNSATVNMNGGASAATLSANNSSVTQQNTTAANNTGVNSGAGSSAGSKDLSNNKANINLGLGNQLTSTVTQDGRNNYADVTLANGGTGTTGAQAAGSSTPANASKGNSSSINQTGAAGGSVAVVVAQNPTGFTGQGVGNSSTIVQNATSPGSTGGTYAGPTGTPNVYNGSSETPYFTGANGLYSVVFQQGQFEVSNINQDDASGAGVTTYGTGSGTNNTNLASASPDSGRVYGAGQVARARASVFQGGIQGSVTVKQSGDNLADVTQGQVGASSAGSSIDLRQVDAGDIVTTTSTGGNTTTQTFQRQSNTATVVQYGSNNSMTLRQNTLAGNISAFQSKNTSGNLMQVEQGTGRSGQFQPAATAGVNGAPVASGTTAYSANPPTGSFTSNMTANVQQGATAGGGSNNGAQVFQGGTNLSATVLQLGTGTVGNTGVTFNTTMNGGAANTGNIVEIGQQGSNNAATARQLATVAQSVTGDPASGPAGNPQSFAGGARSPEIDILQSGSGNKAFVEQRGAGQYARIEQSGSTNVAGIIQDTGATNATARIFQTGTGNSYYIVQDTPGQFLSVTQTGSNNTSITGSGSNAGAASSGTTPPATGTTFPAF